MTDAITNLVLFGYSGYDDKQRNNLTSIVTKLEQPGIVLLEDAVIGSLKTGEIHPYSELLKKGVSIYCMIEDLEARGMNSSDLEDRISPISFSDLMDLIEESQRLISWL